MEENVKPISPEEIGNEKIKTIPVAMIQAVNELLSMKWNGTSATLRQDDIMARYFKIIGKENDRANRDEVFDKHMLDFEHAYRSLGWKVYYDRPAYNESYEPTYEFTKKKKVE
jgi:hypothetical protein